ncbi:MAG: homoserine kinase type II [Candidatus Azotimanducaceae bacterium]|jgi:homoserine kinase type II
MATYTTFERESLERYLVMFDLGELDAFEPIASGIENSNYYIRFENTDLEYVLTITEGLNFEEVPFFNDLLQVLTKSGLPVPEPQRTLDGMSSTIFKSKPTWLFNRLSGSHPEKPNETQCAEIGVALAKLHVAGQKARYRRKNVYHPDWAKESLASVTANLNSADRQNLKLSVDRYLDERHDDNDMPRGVIHGDLFRDNALFVDNTLTGVIDFYHACDDYYIQDIAITINDWCCEQGVDVRLKKAALLTGYASVRPLEPAEQQALPRFREYAAMRFSLTRLLAGRAGNPIKNPREFLDLLYRLQAGQET